MSAQEFLAHLTALPGVTVWVGEKGGSEFVRPIGWQNLDPSGNAERLKTFQGDRCSVCLNTGTPVAVVDVDTRNGGDVDKVRALLAKLGVRILAEVDTPGGGKHFYVAGHPDLISTHSTVDNNKLPGFPGVDIQSFGCNVFLPGTLRPKHGGGGYTIVCDELDQLPFLNGDGGAQALADWVAEQRAQGVTAKARKAGDKDWDWQPCTTWDGTSPDQRQQAYLNAALGGEVGKVAKAHKGGRNEALFEAALKLGSYVAGAGLDEQQVINSLEVAAVVNGYTADDGLYSTRATIASGLRCGKRNPRAVPPPPPPPPFGSIDGAVLLEDLRAWFARFVVVVSKADLRLLALWVAHTYLSEELYTTPRLLVDSIAPGAGKTTLLEHLDHLCRNPLLAVTMSSAALIPRILEKEQRTLLLDEIQRTLVEGKPGVDEIIAVIGSGYRRGAHRPVLVPKGKDWVLRNLPTFAPVAMAGNSPNLPQDAVDRSIRILLMPDNDGRAEDSDWEILDADVKALAERASNWADSVRAEVKNAEGKLPAGCVSRLREKWRPLMRVAELADRTGGGDFWKDTVREMAENDVADTEAQREAGLRRQTPALVLLQDLHEIWPVNVVFMGTEELVALLVAHNPDYWGAGFWDGRPRKQLNATKFGRMVKQATNSLSVRPGGGGTPRGYWRVQFDRAWKTLKIS
jgi:Protein of unknown function (DUF3631)